MRSPKSGYTVLRMAFPLISRAARQRALALDSAIVLFLAGSSEWRVWIVGNVAGPRWLTAALPLLLDLPLLARRRVPLLALALVIAGVVTQALASGNAAEGFFLVGPIAVGLYSAGAYASRRGRSSISRSSPSGSRASSSAAAGTLPRSLIGLGASNKPRRLPSPRNGRGWRASCTTSSRTT